MHQQRLKEDTNGALAFYERHWETVEEIFNENEELKAKIEAFEECFSNELEKESLEILRDPQAHKSLEEAVGPEFIARTISFFEGLDGINDLERTRKTEGV